MKRLALFVVLSSLVPAIAAAQTTPVPPAPPPAPQAPQAPTPRPAPPAIVLPELADGLFIDRDAIEQQVEAARAAADAARADSASTVAAARAEAKALATTYSNFAFDYQKGFGMSVGKPGDNEGNSYNAAMSLLNNKDYDRAIARFDQVIAQKGAHADAALYWKGYSLYRAGRKDDALAAVAELRKDYPKSHYLDDAKVLEADAHQTKPENTNDDDIKLLAIDSMRFAEPDRALPIIQGVLSSTNSLAIKRRALYELALIDQPAAHALLLSYAKGAGNPDLQRTAISYLATGKTQTTAADLTDIYNSTQDVDIRRAIISAYASSGNRAALMRIVDGQMGPAMAPTPMALRLSAISGLSNNNLIGPQDLWTLYQKEEDKDLKQQMLSAFGSMGAVDQLSLVVKTEKDPTLRQRAIRSLGNMRVEKTGQMLTDLYSSDQDKDTRKAVIDALGNQNNVDGLIAVAKKETDKDLRLQVVRKLVELAPRSKAAADYLMEIIK